MGMSIFAFVGVGDSPTPLNALSPLRCCLEDADKLASHRLGWAKRIDVVLRRCHCSGQDGSPMFVRHLPVMSIAGLKEALLALKVCADSAACMHLLSACWWQTWPPRCVTYAMMAGL